MDKMSCENSFTTCVSLRLRDVVNLDVGGEGELDLSTTFTPSNGRTDGQNEL